MNAGYNPDFNPTGLEGGVDTNDIPIYAGALLFPHNSGTLAVSITRGRSI